MKLRKWNAVALWTYGGGAQHSARRCVWLSFFFCNDLWVLSSGSTDTCAICRNELTDSCPECQLNSDSTAAGECTVVWGTCSMSLRDAA